MVADWSSETAAMPATDSSGTTWYEGEAVFKCKLRCQAPIAKPLEVSVRLQACDANTCMPPATLQVTVDF